MDPQFDLSEDPPRSDSTDENASSSWHSFPSASNVWRPHLNHSNGEIGSAHPTTPQNRTGTSSPDLGVPDRPQQLGEEENIRERLARLRDLRELQSIYEFFCAILPFFALFAIKMTLDNIFDIARITGMYLYFLIVDSLVIRIMTGVPFTLYSRIGFAVAVLLSCASPYVVQIPGFSVISAVFLQYNEFITADAPHTFGFNVYCLIVTDITIKIMTVGMKLLLAVLPDQAMQAATKRRTFQFTEYISQLYRAAVPILIWIKYFLNSEHTAFYDFPLCLVFLLLKGREICNYCYHVYSSGYHLFTGNSFGVVPHWSEYEDVTCAVCHDKLSSPIKLECQHIFCKFCIEKWLDSNTTCPMCRAVITRTQDTEWKSGATSRSIRLY